MMNNKNDESNEVDIEKYLDFIDERRLNLAEMRAMYFPSLEEKIEPQHSSYTTSFKFAKWKFGIDCKD